MPRIFVKMHGAGNDYIFFDCRDRIFLHPEVYAVSLSDRRFGIGGDGIVLILPDQEADCRMRMFNRDGSEGDMCGNAVRCIGKYLFEKTGKRELTVRTNAGLKRVVIGEGISVEMGLPDFAPKSIPIDRDRPLIGEPIGRYIVTAVSMGNPHAVAFVGEEEDPAPFHAALTASRLFPNGVNAEVAWWKNDKLYMRVRERGSGETLSCGTGACAVAAVAVKTGRWEKGKVLPIHTRGGILQIKVTDRGVLLSGEVTKVFTGEIDL